MKKIVSGLAFLMCLLVAQGQNSDLLISNVNYVDVENGRIKQGTILISNGKISAIKKRIKTTNQAQQIDGSGKWLIPGLIDGHIHMFQSGGIYTRPDAINLQEYRSYDDEIKWVQENAGDILKRYLKIGITTVVDPGGPMSNFKIRDRLKNSNNHASLLLAGPLISTYQPQAFQIDDPPIVKVNNEQEAIDLIRKQLPYKPDFIKIWYIVLRDQTAESSYDIISAAIKESHKNNLKVAVHATQLKTAKLAIKAGADILVHSVDEPIDKEFIELVVKNKVTYMPTLMVHGKYVEVFNKKPIFSAEDFLFSNPYPLGSLMDPEHLPEGNDLDSFKSYLPRINQNLKKEDSIRDINLKKVYRVWKCYL